VQVFFWKSWEGHLNLTQTGMNSASSEPFDFSIDNDHVKTRTLSPRLTVRRISDGKSSLTYHETLGKNWFSNRGETSHFITKVDVLDRTPMASIRGTTANAPTMTGHVVDTVYVVIVGRASDKKK
jgi:hypothetical protein